ncbi:MAG: hypothetical protein JO253_04310, partial [Alphaproteobacteria bacterium]|nr:hypothetical protein [Alphaproteobacteria bacterium]
MSDYTEQELEDMLAARRRKKLEAAMPAIGSVTAAHLDQLRNELHESVRQEIGKLRELVQATTAAPVATPPVRQPTPADQIGMALVMDQGKQLVGAALTEDQQLWLSKPGALDPMK